MGLKTDLETEVATIFSSPWTERDGQVVPESGDLKAIIELPGVDRNELNIQAKDNTIRIAGQKKVSTPEKGSAHRRERLWGSFDRTLTVPMQIDPDGIKAEYNDGLLALFIPRSERDKPKNIRVS